MPDGGRVAHGRRDVQHGVGAVEQLGAVTALVRVRGRAVVRDAGDRGHQRALGRVLPGVRADARGRLVVVLGHALPVLFPALDERAAEPLREREPPRSGRGFQLTEAAAAVTDDGAVQLLARLADANHGCDVTRVHRRYYRRRWTDNTTCIAANRYDNIILTRARSRDHSRRSRVEISAATGHGEIIGYLDGLSPRWSFVALITVDTPPSADRRRTNGRRSTPVRLVVRRAFRIRAEIVEIRTTVDKY